MKSSVLILGREPAAWVALVTIIIGAVGAFWAGFTIDTQAWVIAAVAAALNLAVAFVTRDGIIAAVSGFIQAAVSLAVGLGAHLDPTQQFYVLTVVVSLAQFFARQQITPPVPPPAQSALQRWRQRRTPEPPAPAPAA
jgi:drug/metabolite transporter (DMT)-like permease